MLTPSARAAAAVALVLLLAANLPAQDPPAAPQGVEVLARGPVHEAFASLTADPTPTQPVPRHPPTALEEMPPEEKPDGDVLWIAGYWQWDDERKDFLWVSGIWRVAPPGKTWVAGYWKDVGDQSQWVPGFWTDAAARDEAAQQVTYLPQPPAPPQVAPPGESPGPDTFYVPGCWVWNGSAYAWRAGYWARVQPGFVWVPPHYRWTPGGYVYIGGYWDLAVADRGVLYAPVYVDPAVVRVGFVYTPGYVVSDTIVVDALFVRPCCCHYYFGDYYGPVYRDYGFETCVSYSRGHYDAVFVYASYEHRDEPNWVNVQLDISLGRHRGEGCPPRTLVQQTTIINNITVNNVTNVKNVTVNKVQVLAPASQLSSFKGVSTVKLDPAARAQVRQQAAAVQQVAQQRQQAEVASPGGAVARPHVASLNVPKAQPVSVKAPAGGSAAAAGRKLGVEATKARAAAQAPATTPPGGTFHPTGFTNPAQEHHNAPANTAAARPGMAPAAGAPGQPGVRPGQPAVPPGRQPPPPNGQHPQPHPDDAHRRPPPKDGHRDPNDRQ